jgi:levanase/fructan beta-fructosidase
MVLAAGDRTMLYGSKNLKDWKLLSILEGYWSHGGVWECPFFSHAS